MYNRIRTKAKGTITNKVCYLSTTFMNSFGETYAKSTVQKVNSIIRAYIKSVIYGNLIVANFI